MGTRGVPKPNQIDCNIEAAIEKIKGSDFTPAYEACMDIEENPLNQSLRLKITYQKILIKVIFPNADVFHH